MNELRELSENELCDIEGGILPLVVFIFALATGGVAATSYAWNKR